MIFFIHSHSDSRASNLTWRVSQRLPRWCITPRPLLTRPLTRPPALQSDNPAPLPLPPAQRPSNRTFLPSRGTLACPARPSEPPAARHARPASPRPPARTHQRCRAHEIPARDEFSLFCQFKKHMQYICKELFKISFEGAPRRPIIGNPLDLPRRGLLQHPLPFLGKRLSRKHAFFSAPAEVFDWGR